jgi:acyl-CoA synthetase (AMP-forming)/AMP-acid ligase II
VTAVVVFRDGAAASEDDLIKHCRASLAGYETPKSVLFVADLPETVGGKVLKYKLRAEHAVHYRPFD